MLFNSDQEYCFNYSIGMMSLALPLRDLFQSREEPYCTAVNHCRLMLNQIYLVTTVNGLQRLHAHLQLTTESKVECTFEPALDQYIRRVDERIDGPAEAMNLRSNANQTKQISKHKAKLINVLKRR